MTCPNCERKECACIVDTAKIVAENKRLRKAMESACRFIVFHRDADAYSIIRDTLQDKPQ